MAFAIRNLSVLAYANGFTLWHYKSGKDTLDAVSGGNYLADASDMLTAGDLIMVTAADGARIVVCHAGRRRNRGHRAVVVTSWRAVATPAD